MKSVPSVPCVGKRTAVIRQTISTLNSIDYNSTRPWLVVMSTGICGAGQTTASSPVLEVLGLRELLETSMTVRAAVTTNSSHSNAPKTVAALSGPHEVFPAEHVSVET